MINSDSRPPGFRARRHVLPLVLPLVAALLALLSPLAMIPLGLIPAAEAIGSFLAESGLGARAFIPRLVW